MAEGEGLATDMVGGDQSTADAEAMVVDEPIDEGEATAEEAEAGATRHVR